MRFSGRPAVPFGLLIVNADDWGGHADVTHAIERCFSAGAITSATGMVHMPDSARAAELALEHRRPIGMHLNLTEPFAGSDVPSAVRRRQSIVCSHFANLSRRRWTYDPRKRAAVSDAIRDQLDAFHEIYGGPPTHLDSHHHVHVCPDVFLSPAMPRDLPLRTTSSPAPKSGHHRLRDAPRVLKHLALATRFESTDAFFSITTLHPEFGGGGLGSVLEFARTRTVEVMVHPSFDGELPLLLSDRWRELARDVPRGSYAALTKDIADTGDDAPRGTRRRFA